MHDLANVKRMMDNRRVLPLGVAASVLLTALIWPGGRIPAGVAKLPDQGALWYYWKLPTPTFWSQPTAWGMFALHQIAISGCMWWAQQSRPPAEPDNLRHLLAHLCVGTLFHAATRGTARHRGLTR